MNNQQIIKFVDHTDGRLAAKIDIGLIDDHDRICTFEQQTADSITFVFNSGDGLALRRIYSLAQEGSEQDPYIIRHSTTFNNQAATPQALSTIFLNLGTAWAISEKQQPAFLNVGYFDGEDSEFIAINKLTGGKGFLGMGASAPVEEIEEVVSSEWASVKNQFFAAVLTSETKGRDLFVYQVEGAEAKRRTGYDFFAFSIPGGTACSGLLIGRIQILFTITAATLV